MKLTKRRLKQAISSIFRPEFRASEYNDVLKFFDAVESEFDFWYEELISTLGFSTEEEFENEIITSASRLDFSDADWIDSPEAVEETFLNIFLQPYIEDAQDVFYEAYHYENNPIYCTVCGKPMQYWGDDSVMLTDEKWKEVLKFYHLTEYEREARERKARWYAMCERRGNLQLEPPRNCFTYICNDCIEKALGHPIRLEDINTSPFNQSYIKSHFGELTTNESLNEGYFDKTQHTEEVNPDDFVDHSSPLKQICDNPTHRIVFELATNYYKGEKVDEDNDYIRKIPSDVLKKILYYMDNVSNIFSFGNFKFISNADICISADTVDKIEYDARDVQSVISYNDEDLDWKYCGNEDSRYVNRKCISVDISAKFTPVSAMKFFSFFKKIKSTSTSGHKAKSIKNFYILSLPDADVEFSTLIPNYDFNTITDDCILNNLSSMCSPLNKIKLLNYDLTNQPKEEKIKELMGLRKDDNVNNMEHRTDVNPKNYQYLTVFKAYPYTPFVTAKRGEPQQEWKLHEAHLMFSYLTKIMKEALKVSDSFHSGIVCSKEINNWNGRCRVSYFLCDDCFVLQGGVYCICMSNNVKID